MYSCSPFWKSLLISLLLGFLSPCHLAAEEVDTDLDGIIDSLDCNPVDPAITSPHTYYFDFDGDQFGSAANPATLCDIVPFPGTVPWANDPDDSDGSITQVFTGKADRQIGLDFLDPAEDGQWLPDLPRELGASVVPLSLVWSLVEVAAGDYSGPQGSLLTAFSPVLSNENLQLALSINPINQNTLSIPADLATAIEQGTLTFSDASVINRFTALLDKLNTDLGNARLHSLQLGFEVDAYMASNSDPTFWWHYFQFVTAVKTYAQSLWSINVGVNFSYEGIADQSVRTFLGTWFEQLDFIGINFLPHNFDYTALPLVDTHILLEQLITQTTPHQLQFYSVGYPSSPRTLSSTTMQSQFYGNLFALWDAHSDRIPLISFDRLNDWNITKAQEKVSSLNPPVAAEHMDNAVAFYQSLGFRSYPGSGNPQSSYDTFRTQSLNRGWWESILPSKRPFLLGMTAEPHDHNPGGDIIQAALDATVNDVSANADLIAFHFDKGVPWTEAFNDTFASQELPYSNHLKQVWQTFRDSKPAGSRLAVSINALGVPRDLLADYWGQGDGYYLNANFERTPNGLNQDYNRRLLPAPFDTLSFNAPEVKQAFLNYAKRTLMYFQPDYFIFGVELDLALSGGQTTADQVVELYAYVYQQLKADPQFQNTPIVASFSIESLLNDEFGVPYLVENIQDPTLAAKHLQVLVDLLPYIDMVGLSFYPTKSRFRSSVIPANMFRDLFATLSSITNKPIAITETGYPAASFEVGNLSFNSSPEKQAMYMRLLMQESLKNSQLEFITNFLARDNTPYMDKLRARSLEIPPFISPDLISFFQYFEHTGIFDQNGQARLASTVWQSLFQLPTLDAFANVTPVQLSSPDSRLQAQFQVNYDGRLNFILNRDGQELLLDSPLGMTVDGIDLGSNVLIIDSSPAQDVYSSYSMHGRKSLMEDHHNFYQLTLHRIGQGDALWKMNVRMYNDGIAYQYVIPGNTARTVSGEATGWNLLPQSDVWFQTETDNYEGEFRHLEIGFFNNEIGAPTGILLPNNLGYLTITEAALFAYSGMTLKTELASNLISTQFLDDVSWQVDAGSGSPWRVTIVAEDAHQATQSQIVHHVNPPPDLKFFPYGVHTPWIKPGKAVWSWWSDFYSGFNFDKQMLFVDYAHQLGFEYSVVDAWWEDGFAEANGNTDPYPKLQELVDYAHADGKNVGIWVWKNWFELLDDVVRQEFFQKVKATGVVGIKVDNVASDFSESVDSLYLYELILQEAAVYELMINFHGANKSTGLSRTYPNEITREGFLGLELNSLLWEHNWWVNPRHNATVPFTRYIAGSADYTPMTLDPRKIGNTTFTHQFATFGIFQSSVTHMAEDPALVLAQTLILDLLREMPTTWDETIVLAPSEIGELVVMARRSAKRWWLFVINGNDSATKDFTITDLSFLDAGTYRGIQISDQSQTEFKRDELNFTKNDSINVSLLVGGGLVISFEPDETGKRDFAMGVSSFPNQSQAADLYLAGNSDLIGHVFWQGIPWDRALASADSQTYSTTLQSEWELVLQKDNLLFATQQAYCAFQATNKNFTGLSPRWGGSIDSLPPVPWDTIDWDHTDVQLSLLNYYRAAIDKFNCQYLAMNIDANIIMPSAPLSWLKFKDTMMFIYDTLKAEYPQIKIFSIIQYEHLLGLHTESQQLADDLIDYYPGVLWNEVKDLFTHSDLIGISTYPQEVPNPQVDKYYYELAYGLATEMGKPLVFHTVFPSETSAFSSSESLQNLFLDYLIETIRQRGNVEFIYYWNPLDQVLPYNQTPWVFPFEGSGFLRVDGSEKTSATSWGTYQDDILQ